MATDPAVARRDYADELARIGPIERTPELTTAFAAVPRERFLGPGPWRIIVPHASGKAFTAPDTDRCSSIRVRSPSTPRGINNGQPSLWARAFDRLGLKPGAHCMCGGTGLLQRDPRRAIGPAGRLVAGSTSRSAERRLRRGRGSRWCGDGRTHDRLCRDAIAVCAGSTHPRAVVKQIPRRWRRAGDAADRPLRLGIMLRVDGGRGLRRLLDGKRRHLPCAGGRDTPPKTSCNRARRLAQHRANHGAASRRPAR